MTDIPEPDFAYYQAMKDPDIILMLKITRIGRINIIDKIKYAMKNTDSQLVAVLAAQKYGDAVLMLVGTKKDREWYPEYMRVRIPIAVRKMFGTIIMYFKPEDVLTMLDRDVPNVDSDIQVRKNRITAHFIYGSMHLWTFSISTVEGDSDLTEFVKYNLREEHISVA